MKKTEFNGHVFQVRDEVTFVPTIGGARVPGSVLCVHERHMCVSGRIGNGCDGSWFVSPGWHYDVYPVRRDTTRVTSTCHNTGEQVTWSWREDKWRGRGECDGCIGCSPPPEAPRCSCGWGNLGRHCPKCNKNPLFELLGG